MDNQSVFKQINFFSQQLTMFDERIKNIQAFVDQRVDSFENDLEILESRINNLRG